MTWLEFNTLVRVHLVNHNRRQGIQTLIDTLIKAAVLDLQSAIPELRLNQTSKFTSATLLEQDTVSIGSLCPGSKPRRVFVREIADPSNTDDVVFFDERHADKLDTGAVAQSPRLFIYNPVTGMFKLSPALSLDSSELVIIWDGSRSDFVNTDEVGFDSTVAEVVSEYVLRKLSLDVDRDVQMAAIHQQQYVAGKRSLLSDIREQQLPA